jgi:hypothetical protein
MYQLEKVRKKLANQKPVREEGLIRNISISISGHNIKKETKAKLTNVHVHYFRPYFNPPAI